MKKLDHFIVSRTEGVKALYNQGQLRACYDKAAQAYKEPETRKRGNKTS